MSDLESMLRNLLAEQDARMDAKFESIRDEIRNNPRDIDSNLKMQSLVSTIAERKRIRIKANAPSETTPRQVKKLVTVVEELGGRVKRLEAAKQYNQQLLDSALNRIDNLELQVYQLKHPQPSAPINDSTLTDQATSVDYNDGVSIDSSSYAYGGCYSLNESASELNESEDEDHGACVAHSDDDGTDNSYAVGGGNWSNDLSSESNDSGNADVATEVSSLSLDNTYAYDNG